MGNATSAVVDPAEQQRAFAEAITSVPDTRRRSVVVVGAHYFGRDVGDPLHAAVRDVPWGGALLVEASPVIFAKLSANTAERSPFRHVVPLVVNAGVAANSSSTSMPFFHLDDTHGLPNSASQIGSFRRQHVQHYIDTWSVKLPAMRKRHIVTDLIPCRSLTEELSRHPTLPPPAVLMIDTEGLDCAIVAAQPWCAGLQPSFVIFEWYHCPAEEREAAQAKLAAARCHGGRRYVPMAGGVASFGNLFYHLTDAAGMGAAAGRRSGGPTDSTGSSNSHDQLGT